ncbi:hypothetical protein CHR62_12250 [Pusillimonas sp. NJUB218]|nr:hypothetical protein CHR62_12250 [Pusillimonas sp. NJUB218]
MPPTGLPGVQTLPVAGAELVGSTQGVENAHSNSRALASTVKAFPPACSKPDQTHILKKPYGLEQRNGSSLSGKRKYR